MGEPGTGPDDHVAGFLRKRRGFSAVLGCDYRGKTMIRRLRSVRISAAFFMSKFRTPDSWNQTESAKRPLTHPSGTLSPAEGERDRVRGRTSIARLGRIREDGSGILKLKAVPVLRARAIIIAALAFSLSVCNSNAAGLPDKVRVLSLDLGSVATPGLG